MDSLLLICSSGKPLAVLLMLVVLAVSALRGVSAGDFLQDVDVSWGDGRGQILNNSQLLTLSLDKTSGSGFQSRTQYLFGKISLQIKLVPGNSAGTVTTFYLKSQGTAWDEIDFEFLGNLSGEPYVLHTNVYAQGKGEREQQFYLWFDPTIDFHTYSILWNPILIVFYVDGRPIREFRNLGQMGVSYPKTQPMRMYCSIWNADDWATRGGLVKTDWSESPFTASFKNFEANGCLWSNGVSSCSSNSSASIADNKDWYSEQLGTTSHRMLRWVQKNYMIYNYCRDKNRFPHGIPTECKVKNKKNI